MIEKSVGLIRLGYTVDGLLNQDIGNMQNMLILGKEADSYLIYLIHAFSENKVLFNLYDLTNQVAYYLPEKYNVTTVRELLPSILSYDGIDYILSSRFVAEAFRLTLSLSEDEFLLLNSILQTLYKQSDKINLLQVVSSIRSYDSKESAAVERSAAMRLDWRLYLINDLLLHTISKEGSDIIFNRQNIFDLSGALSIEGRFLLLCLLLVKYACSGSCGGFQILYLGEYSGWAKVGVLKYIDFLDMLFPRKGLVIVCKLPFPQNRVQNYQIAILGRESIEYLKDIHLTSNNGRISEGELICVQGSRATPFFFEKKEFKRPILSEQKAISSGFKKVSDNKIAKRVLEIVSKSENVSRVGVAQALSVDFPIEMVEFILDELISINYIIAEVKRSKTGLSTKLSISMDGRSWLATEGNKV